MRNIVDLELDGTAAPLLQEDVTAFQAHFGVVLPTAHIDFLKAANGGCPFGVDTFDYTLDDGRIIKSGGRLGFLYYLTADREDISDLWDNTKLLREAFTEIGRHTNVVAIGVDGSIHQIYLDMETVPASVHIFYRSSDNATPIAAESFEQFLDGLHHWPGRKQHENNRPED